MRRSVLTLLFVLAASTAAHASLTDTWQEVQAGLATGDAARAEQALQVLQEEAAELEVDRMPAFAQALVTWAEVNPGANGGMALRKALELDPQYPSAHFLRARWSWQAGAYSEAARQNLRGWIALLQYEPSRRGLVGWLLLWTVTTVGFAFVAMIAVITLRYLRDFAFDAHYLSRKLFRPANAWVMTFVVILLPLFAGLGPVWLAAYLFIMSWVYMGQALRIWAFVACLALAFISPTLAWVQHQKLRSPQLPTRVGTILDERQLDFSTLAEFAHLEGELEESAAYHLLLGELYRMHGEPLTAIVEFQKSTLLDQEQSRSLVFVGNLTMEKGDTQRAIQLYSSALKINDREAFAYQNLSLAFDLNRRFQEGDSARSRAREIGGRDVAEQGLRGLDPRIRYPRLSSADVESFVGELSPDQRMTVGIFSSSTEPLQQFFSAVSRVFLVAAVAGLVMLFVRLRWFSAAKECTKCGKVYRLETGFGESTVYCSQCVSVFLKRDVVSIEQQSSKLGHIKRWERLTVVFQHLVGFVVPGSQHFLGGSVSRGVVIGFFAWFFLLGSVVWVPLGLPRIDPLIATGKIQIGLFVLYLLIALRSGIAAWNRR
jgi:tetratricopeptide (TPR) repeat protein